MARLVYLPRRRDDADTNRLSREWITALGVDINTVMADKYATVDDEQHTVKLPTCERGDGELVRHYCEQCDSQHAALRWKTFDLTAEPEAFGLLVED